MKLKLSIVLLVLIFGTILCLVFLKTDSKKDSFNPLNTSYEIEGKMFTLKNGESQTEIIPGSTSKIITRYFGNEAKGDLNNDGLEDTAFLITQETGGTGLFYYAVVALGTNGGYRLTNTFFIGDRIAPQNNMINTSAQELYINYAERRKGESMNVPPSVGAVTILRVTSEDRLVGLMQ